MIIRKTLLAGLLVAFSASVGYTSGTIHHTLDPQVKYIKGDFEHSTESGCLFTIPTKPQEPSLQSVGVCKKTFQELPYEKVLMRVIPGVDGRSRVTDTHKWPYRLFGQMSMIFSDGEYAASGFMAGPHHFLTAAHNVYDLDKGGWISQLVVRLGMNGDMLPFNELRGVKIYTFRKWTENHDPDFDIALVILNKSIGLQTGWCGLLSSPTTDLLRDKDKVNVTGYPGDKESKEMWSMGHTLKEVNEHKLSYEIDTCPGQSGSAVWISKLGNPYVIGVHTRGEGLPGTGNSGVRLSGGKFNKIVTEWIPETLEIKQGITKNSLKALNPYLPDSQEASYASKLSQAVQKGDSRALAELFEIANEGNMYAQFDLGGLLVRGWGIKQDSVQAVEWVKAAAKQGHIHAQLTLGNWYRGVQLDGYKQIGPDYKKAFKWFMKIAENDSLEPRYQMKMTACATIGIMYRNGQHVAPNHVEARKWLEKAGSYGKGI